jgi:serine/threonine protein phosphatase 1
MKYFVVADVHGFYDEMKDALDAAGFDPENENHTLVSCGDAIDRGPRPNEVIKYFVNLPRKILIRGNHEDLMDELMDNPWGPMMHDHTNGTYDTLIELASKHHKVNYGTKISKSLGKYMEWDELKRFAKAEKTYRAYRDLLVDYFETEHYIFVHGWIPNFTHGEMINGKWCKCYEYMDNWRNASPADWSSARWTSGIECTILQIFEPNKTIVCGHWHAAAWHQHFEDAAPYADHSPYVSKSVIALDTCTALSKKVNVFVIED